MWIMPEIAKYHEKEELIFVEGYGEVTSADVNKVMQYISSTAASFKVKGVLIDHRKVTLLPDFVNAFNLGSQVGQKLKNLNIALVFQPAFQDQYSLFRNSGNTRGANIKLFSNRGKALDWLQKS